jgi:hypothetical protein
VAVKGIGFDAMGGLGTANKVGDGDAVGVGAWVGPGARLGPGESEGEGVRIVSAPPEHDERTRAIPTTRTGARPSAEA